MLGEQRIKKVIKQIVGYEKNIDFADVDKFIHNKQAYHFKIDFDLFCGCKFFFIELGSHESYFFKNACFVGPAYEIDGKPVVSLDLKDILWVKFNLNKKSFIFLPDSQKLALTQPQNYVIYKDEVHFAPGGVLTASDIIMGTLLEDIANIK